MKRAVSGGVANDREAAVGVALAWQVAATRPLITAAVYSDQIDVGVVAERFALAVVVALGLVVAARALVAVGAAAVKAVDPVAVVAVAYCSAAAAGPTRSSV